MKSVIFYLAAAVWLFGFVANLPSQTPPEQLQQMVAQLQKTPTDTALREKIIKLAATTKPSPTVPDEAIKYEGRAQFAFKNAKSEADFVSAAEEYEKAVTAAPWVAGYYSDLCTIYEKANKYEDAKRNCVFYLVSLTDANEITDLKRRIAGLDYGIEKSSPAAIAEREKQELVEKLKAFDGAVFVEAWRPMADGARVRRKAKISGSEMVLGSEWLNADGTVWEAERIFGEQFSYARARGWELFHLAGFDLTSTKQIGCDVGGKNVEGIRKIKIDLDRATVAINQCDETFILRRQ